MIGQHRRDLLLVHLDFLVALGLRPRLLELGATGAQLLLLVAQPRRLLVFLAADRRFLLLHDLLELLFELVDLGGHRAHRQPRAGARLVDDVDRLVREEAVVHVAVRELHRLHDRVVGDLHAVVRLVLVAQPHQDLDGVLDAGLVHHDGLEPPLERAVLLDVLAVLVERGGADALQLAARQRGLEHVRGVDGALGAAGADDRVQLVDEDHRVLGLADLVHHGLQPLLELAAVLGAGHDGRQVERDDALVLEALRHLRRR